MTASATPKNYTTLTDVTVVVVSQKTSDSRCSRLC
jgi:hypothetical protein